MGTWSWPHGGSTQPGAFLHHCSWRSSLVQREMGLGCSACFTYLNGNISMGYVPKAAQHWENRTIWGFFPPLDTPYDCFVLHKWERNSERFHGMIINFATCHLIWYIDSDWVLGKVSVRIVEEIIWRALRAQITDLSAQSSPLDTRRWQRYWQHEGETNCTWKVECAC